MPTTNEAQPVTQRRIFLFFAPLAVSWIFMSLEGPITAGIIARSPGESVALAAFGLLLPISIFIESPVIDLLSTSTTLARTHANYLQLRKFTAILMLWVSAVHALVALSPFYWVLVEQWIKAPHDVAVALRPGMVIMIPWAAFVGWRRFHHGILIRFDNTRPVGIGTTVRVVAVAAICLLLCRFSDLSGLVIAAAALVGSVIAETIFVHFVAIPTIKRNLDPMIGTEEDKGVPLKRLWQFHMPLTLSTMTMILSMPLVLAALTRSPNSEVNLAAWGVSMSVVFMFRAVTFALPETIITLYKDDPTRSELAKFCTRVGIVCSAAIVLAYFSGAADYLFHRVLDSELDVARAASFALLVSVAVPLVNSRASLVRGLLTAHHRTKPRIVAIGLAVGALSAALALGVAMRWDGLIVIGIGMTIQVVAELVVLAAYWRNTDRVLADFS
jgi:hypothetical protein